MYCVCDRGYPELGTSIISIMWAYHQKRTLPTIAQIHKPPGAVGFPTATPMADAAKMEAEAEPAAVAAAEPAAEPEPLPLEEAPAAEAVAAKDGPIACYRAVKKATLRAEFDVKSSQTGSAKKNEILPVFEERDEDDPYGFGLKRVRCELGWVSVISKDSSAILQAMDLEEGLKLIAEGANDAAEEALAEPEPEVSAAGPVVAKLDIAADDENPQRKSINDMFAQKIISEEERDDMLAKMDRQEEQARAEKEQSSLWTEAVGIFNKKVPRKSCRSLLVSWLQGGAAVSR